MPLALSDLANGVVKKPCNVPIIHVPHAIYLRGPPLVSI
jgi:hypothetical protein